MVRTPYAISVHYTAGTARVSLNVPANLHPQCKNIKQVLNLKGKDCNIKSTVVGKMHVFGHDRLERRLAYQYERVGSHTVVS